jgi:hypothetical protein
MEAICIGAIAVYAGNRAAAMKDDDGGAIDDD